jgi:quercetin dioxygenase-like cupin family protein
MTQEPNKWIELCPGIRRRTLTHGAALYQMMAELDEGSTMPAHAHPQEQITHILSGRVVMILDGVRHDLRAGDSLLIPSNVSHGAETIEQTLVIDTFSPPRDDYLARDGERGGS